jgi:hypothetical protein
MKAIALEEGENGEEDDGTDLEANQAPRPTARLHAVKISVAIMLVIITQALGVSKVRQTCDDRIGNANTVTASQPILVGRPLVSFHSGKESICRKIV